MKRIYLLAIHTSPLLLGIILSYFFWRQNLVLLAIYLIIAFAVMVFGRDTETELKIFVYGMAAGFVIEVLGTQISGYQKFLNPDIGGIPLWLLAAWGYAFVMMKRVSLIIATGSPWTRSRAQ